MRQLITEAAPYLGFVKDLKLDATTSSELKLAQKFIENQLELEYFEEAEVPESQAVDTDYVVRSKGGATQPGFYRIEQKMNDKERNMLRWAYALKYGTEDKTLWQNYLKATPINVGTAIKHGKSFYDTEIGDKYGGGYIEDELKSYDKNK